MDDQTYVVMRIDLVSGEKEPLFVSDDQGWAVEWIEQNNGNLRTCSMPEDGNMFGLHMAGSINPYNRHFHYLKRVPKAGRE